MNLGVIETQLLPQVQRAVAARASAHAGPPVFGAATGMKFDVWVHAARFEDLGGVTAEGATVARRPARLRSGARGFAEERPARVVVEITVTGPTCAGVQEICGLLPPVVLVALETMPHPDLSALPNGSVTLRFADFSSCVHSVGVRHVAADDAGWFQGTVGFRLDGFLHVLVTKRGGLGRPLSGAGGAPRLRMQVVQQSGEDAGGEHVVITNDGEEPVRLEGFVLRDDATRRPNRLVLPAVTLPAGGSLKVWSGKGKGDAANVYWGRRRPVWNDRADAATLLDPSGAPVARVLDPERRA